jgi:membrane fusion protein (multidrug efflux system)
MRRPVHYIILLSVTIVAWGCDSNGENKGSQQRGGNRLSGALEVEGFVVEPRNVSETIEVPGTLLPGEVTQIRCEVNGRVVKLNIPEGEIVKKGTVLVKLFDADLQAQLRKVEVQLQIAIKSVERQRELLAINGISQQDFDLSELSAENLKADIESLKIAIGKTEIRAPYEGQVGLRNVSLGSYLAPADVITTLRDIKQLKVEFFVPEKYAKSIDPGFRVVFRVDGGAVDHEAKVMATEGNVDQTTRTLKIRALVTSRHKELVPGLFARVNLQLGEDNAALMIPSQAVIPEARNKQVIVLRKDTAVFNIVETGIRDSAYVQVLSGLKSGDTVITTGLMAIRPSFKIKVTKVNRLPAN